MQIKKSQKTEVVASRKVANSAKTYDKAQKHIKAAIDILASYDDEVAKDSIANLGVVMLDLMGSTDIKENK